jgi:hypothetical protein
MAITWPDGLEPIRFTSPTSYRTLGESLRRSVSHLQGTIGNANPLETYITFPTGIYRVDLVEGGSGYLNPPDVAILPMGSSGGSGATVTATVEAINPGGSPPTDGSVIGLTLTANGSGYVKILAGINQELTSPGVIITGVDTRFTFTDDDIDMSTNVITKTAHGMSDNDRIHLTTDNILTYGLYDTDDIGNVYSNPDFYVINATTDTFKLSKTLGGTAVEMESRHAIGTAIIQRNVAEGEPDSNLVSTVNLTDGGRAYVTAPTIVFSAPPEGGTQATGTVIITDGYVSDIEMIKHGSGYLTAPTFTLTGGHGTHTVRYGGGATAQCNLGHGATAKPITDTTGVVTGITMLTSGGGTGATASPSNIGDSVGTISGLSGGSGFSSPTVSFSGGGGSGATATATESGGVIDSVTLTAGGSGYTSAPAIAFSGGGGSGASATAGLTIYPYITSIDVTAGGSNYVTAPTVVFDNEGTGGSGATATAHGTNGVITSVSIVTAGSGYTSMPTISFFGGGYYINTTVDITSGGNTDSTGSGATATCTLEAAAVKTPTVTTGGTGYASLRSLSDKAAAVSTDPISIDKAIAVAESAIIAGWIVNLGGSGYTSPTVVFSPPSSGTTATGTAVVSGGVITAITIISGGSGYSSAPSISYTGGGGSGAGGNVIITGDAVTSVRMNNLPIAWESAGYTVANATSVKSAVDEYIVKCTEAENAIASLLAQISVSTVGNFLEHSEMQCGLQEARLDPYKAAFHEIMGAVQGIEDMKDIAGVPRVNYSQKLFRTLLYGDDAINTTMVHLNDNPLSAGTYDPLNITSRMFAASSNASTLIAEIVVVQIPLAAWVANVSGDVGAFNTLRTSDETELATAEAWQTYFLEGQRNNGYWVQDYTKFMYTNVAGSKRAMQILKDAEDGNIN